MDGLPGPLLSHHPYPNGSQADYTVYPEGLDSATVAGAAAADTAEDLQPLPSCCVGSAPSELADDPRLHALRRLRERKVTWALLVLAAGALLAALVLQGWAEYLADAGG
jgi:hypothetical protein